MIEMALNELTKLGLDKTKAIKLLEQIESLSNKQLPAEQIWQSISASMAADKLPFSIQLTIFTAIYPSWREHPESAAAWIPHNLVIENSNINKFMKELGINNIESFQQWTTNQYQDFWRLVTHKLNIFFTKKSAEICDLKQSAESPIWFPDAQLNISDSCFNASPSATALVYEDENRIINKISYAELNCLSNKIANGLVKSGFVAGDAIGIAMPMNLYAIATYLAVIKMGGVVVSIADSFSSQEIATRLNIANAKCIVTQDFISWGHKQLPLYEKVCQATDIQIIVVPIDENNSLPLRAHDHAWKNFISDNSSFTSVACDPMVPCNILFSSGTTAEPKAIIWNHTTPIKAASDAFFHQNIQAGDVLCWPTNLGWMMGPWLIFAALINQASIALYTDAPKNRAFGEYIQNTNVTMLGVVPTLVANWRQTKCMEGLDWSSIKTFSSTGECSNAEDMLYLMSLANYKPVIEYCGGTEIGGAYLSSTVIENNYPSLFSTATMGLSFKILDDTGHVAELGEVAIVPPSIGLSTQLLNADHHQIYFENMPKTSDGKIMRRHGDQIKKISNHAYSIMGRVDDAMNLGGIKISAAEIERAISGTKDIIEVAAIAVTPPDNGPSQLVIYAATNQQHDKLFVMNEMQKKINAQLNPLFKIHDLVFTHSLPKTASNKIMRRMLRKEYMEK